MAGCSVSARAKTTTERFSVIFSTCGSPIARDPGASRVVAAVNTTARHCHRAPHPSLSAPPRNKSSGSCAHSRTKPPGPKNNEILGGYHHHGAGRRSPRFVGLVGNRCAVRRIRTRPGRGSAPKMSPVGAGPVTLEKSSDRHAAPYSRRIRACPTTGRRHCDG